MFRDRAISVMIGELRSQPLPIASYQNRFSSPSVANTGSQVISVN